MTDVAIERPSAQISLAALEERKARILAWMDETGLDAIVAYGGAGVMGSRSLSACYVRYLTGWTTTALPAIAVLPRTGTASVITMGPHDTRAFQNRAAWFGDVLRAGAVAAYPTVLRDLLASLGTGATIGTLGFGEITNLLVDDVEGALAGYRLVDAEPGIDRLRLQRHPDEVEMHRIASRISDAMVAAAMENATVPGMTGDRLMALIEYAGRSLGAGTPTTWLTVEEHPVTTYMEPFEVAHPVGENDRIQLGTSLTYQGYFAQGLRMGVRGAVSPTLRDYMQKLLDIQDAALDAMRPGAKLHVVSDIIEAGIDRACPYARDTDPFRFQSCHGLGLTYVESGMARDLNPRRDRGADADGVVMAPGMVIEVHPNFTTPEVGHVCAGDVALITENGAEWLTHYPRGLVEL